MKVSDIHAERTRTITPNVSVSPRFPGRWSPRAMSGAPLTREEVMVLLEAARWAPSCFNAQPWRFVFALKGTEGWQSVFDALVEGNRVWAKKAGAFVVVITRREFERNDRPNPTHSFDGGAAWMSLALQAAENGLVAHAMQGFDENAARRALTVPNGYDIPAIIALGHPGEVETLPENLRERETPSPRKKLEEIVFEGDFRRLST
jgi:nitroreductase